MTYAHTQRFERADCSMSRRRLLACSGLALVASLLPGSVFAHLRRSVTHEKSLAFYNTHTGESLKIIYWVQGEYVAEALGEINHLWRDYRVNEERSIDPELLDLLFAMRARLETRQPFHIISGYRSPATNDRLYQQSKKVAKDSLHIVGKAVDIRLPGISTAMVRRVAMGLQRGGVGYYPRSNFVHVDTGRVRYW